MKLKYSGNVYRFPLDFEFGYAYGQVLDYSDISDFDGILLRVFNIVEKEELGSKSIAQLKNSGIMFGPAPVNKYPTAKSGWKLYGKDNDFPKAPPLFKNLRGLLVQNNWAKLTPWFKQNRFDEKTDDKECEYEHVRHLETMILNHLDSIKIKITMMNIINNAGKVSDYYDLKQQGHKNLYVQIVNTYYDKEFAEKLLLELK
jgi:hypothetical protein